jgi:catechol 2,3-dioxygenase-like lactoylglutathione lyase family enzyme
MKILFVSSFSIISPNPKESRKIFIDTLGLPLKQYENTEYFMSPEIDGVKHFSIWPLSEVAKACFGDSEWPKDKTVPQSSVEFEVASAIEVTEAAKELQEKGYNPLHEARTEPWGQTVTRLQSPDGNIIGISFAPWMHKKM